MQITVHGEGTFRAQKNQLAIGPSESGYTLAYSADGINFTNDTDAVVPANENLIYLGSMQYGWYKLVGNTGDVSVLV